MTLSEDFLCDGFSFTKPATTASSPSLAKWDNSAWTRARMSALVCACWTEYPPPVSTIWAMVYSVFSCMPDLEIFRLELLGADRELIVRELQFIGLATLHPSPSTAVPAPLLAGQEYEKQLIVSRASFWQGAGSPFGPRPAWLVAQRTIYTQDVQNQYPIRPLQYTMTTGFPETPVHARHPIRPPTPNPGSTIYSRYIPHLGETFSMVALEWSNEKHANYFHEWQNEPRVAEGWNQTGSLEEHREYLRKVHNDPHQFTVLGLFDDTPFAYFEIYWAKVCILDYLLYQTNNESIFAMRLWQKMKHAKHSHRRTTLEPITTPRTTTAVVTISSETNGFGDSTASKRGIPVLRTTCFLMTLERTLLSASRKNREGSR